MASHDHDRASRQRHLDEYSPVTSGAATPTTGGAPASYLHSSVSGLVSGFGGLVRRISDMTTAQQQAAAAHKDRPLGWPAHYTTTTHGGVYTPPIHRSASPMRPPPLEPLQLRGFGDDTQESARLLTSAVAEEIRIMVPERQRIGDEWNLVYSLDQDGASLGTLYKACSPYVGERTSFVLVVRDNEGGLFGAYLSEAPHPRAHYFGNGECFLWRASIITSLAASLPPPPSEDTTHLGAARITTIASPPQSTFPTFPTIKRPPPPAAPEPEEDLLIDFSDIPEPRPSTGFSDIPDPRPSTGFSDIPDPPDFFTPPTPTFTTTTTQLAAAAPVRAPSPALSIGPLIRFKAFPYSGENDFYLYCEPHWLSVGGGDGHYGLWLNDSLEKGVSSRCLTFGNEPLSDEGEKFGVLGVEVWMIGRGDVR